MEDFEKGWVYYEKGMNVFEFIPINLNYLTSFPKSLLSVHTRPDSTISPESASMLPINWSLLMKVWLIAAYPTVDGPGQFVVRKLNVRHFLCVAEGGFSIMFILHTNWVLDSQFFQRYL